MRLALLVGPFRTDPETTTIAAQFAAKNLWNSGCSVISSHLNTGPLHGEVDGDRIGDGYTKIMVAIADEVDYLIVLPGWEHSGGTLREMELARMLEIPVYEYSDITENFLGDRLVYSYGNKGWEGWVREEDTFTSVI